MQKLCLQGEVTINYSQPDQFACTREVAFQTRTVMVYKLNLRKFKTLKNLSGRAISYWLR